MTTWISHAEAAALVGCAVSTLEEHLDEIRRRPNHGSRPSLDRASVLTFAAHRQAQQAELVRRAECRREAARLRSACPPADGDVWFDSRTVAAMLGCTHQYVNRLAASERIPATRRGRRWWFRRRDIEQHAAARACVTVHGFA